jgi:hypothetical protein
VRVARGGGVVAKRKYICPNCGNKTGANILYGMPARDLVQNDNWGLTPIIC